MSEDGGLFDLESVLPGDSEKPGAATDERFEPYLQRVRLKLVTTLQVAVILRIDEYRRYTIDGRQAAMLDVGGHKHDKPEHGECHTLSDMIAAHGDDLIFGGPFCRDTFNALAKSIALLAFAPGGVTALGRHWCVGSGHMGVDIGQSSGPCDEECDREEREKAGA